MNFDFVGKYWRGEQRLWKAFWLFGALGNLIMSMTQKLIAVASLEVATLFSILALIYGIWSIVSIWNCAYNVNWRWWGHITRGYIILQIVLTIFAIGMYVGGINIPGQIT